MTPQEAQSKFEVEYLKRRVESCTLCAGGIEQGFSQKLGVFHQPNLYILECTAPTLTQFAAERIAELEARAQWKCFHCGFETSDEKEASAHFGDMDDEYPLCVTWSELTSDERTVEYQSTMGELNAERDENINLRAKNEGLEYRVDGQLAEIHSFKPFRQCSSVNEIFHLYDSMEGRALLAESELAAEKAAREAAELCPWCGGPETTDKDCLCGGTGKKRGLASGAGNRPR